MSDCLYLIHHGVKGQKWGVRRYQNPDGTLTPEGRKRYGIVESTKAYIDRNRKSAKKYRSDLKRGASDRYKRMDDFSKSSKGMSYHEASRRILSLYMNTAVASAIGDKVARAGGKAVIKLALKKNPNLRLSDADVERLLNIASDNGALVGASIGAVATAGVQVKKSLSSRKNGGPSPSKTSKPSISRSSGFASGTQKSNPWSEKPYNPYDYNWTERPSKRRNSPNI